MTDNLIDFYEKALDEANNRNTISKKANVGNGKNIYRQNSSNSGKGKTATTVGAHGNSKLSRKQRKALNQQKQQEQKPQTEEPKEEQKPTEEQTPQTDNREQETQNPVEEQKPQTEAPKENDKKTDGENDLSDADITYETRQESATEIVNKRVNFFNNTLASLYRIAGNLVARNEVFPIFNAKKTQAEQPKQEHTENASFNSDFANAMLSEVRLFEDEEKANIEANKAKEQTNQETSADKVNLEVSFATEMKQNKFTSNLVNLAKTLQIYDFKSLTNIGKFCAVVGTLVSKYRELAGNIAKVNEYIKVDEIKLDGESINMNINNAQLKQLFQFFKGTPGENAIRVLNAFCAKNIASITANTNLNKLIKALPNEINAEFAKKFNTNSFNLSIPSKIFNNENFPKSWFNFEENQGTNTEDKSKTAETAPNPINKEKEGSQSEQSDAGKDTKK